MAIEQFYGPGTYREGTISNVLNYIKPIKAEFDAGKLSQTDYLNKLNEVVPEAYQLAHSIAGQGSSAAKAAQNAGLNELSGIYNDMEIYKSATELIGRDITPQEFAQFKPRFADGKDTGRAYLAEFAQNEAKSPKALEGKAGQYSGQIGGYYQDLMKRGATAEEADYFGRLLATGEVTPYEIQQFIKATPEYQTGQDKAFREDLSNELAGYDEKAFGRERENILSQYTKAGLQNSSALDFAITDALGKLQENRSGFLGNLSASQYGGNKENARADYSNYLNQYLGNQDYNRNRSDQYLDYLTQRADQGADYTRQKNDYLQFLQSQPQQRGGSNWGQLAGGLIGAGIGSSGGPTGASAGYQIGSGIGGGFDYFNY